MSFKTELHCHSRDISPCSLQDVDGIVEKYTSGGYASLVLTNHAGEYIFNVVIPDGTWKSKVDYYFDAAEKLRDAAGDRLTIIDGMELRLSRIRSDTREILRYPRCFLILSRTFPRLREGK